VKGDGVSSGRVDDEVSNRGDDVASIGGDDEGSGGGADAMAEFLLGDDGGKRIVEGSIVEGSEGAIESNNVGGAGRSGGDGTKGRGGIEAEVILGESSSSGDEVGTEGWKVGKTRDDDGVIGGLGDGV